MCILINFIFPNTYYKLFGIVKHFKYAFRLRYSYKVVAITLNYKKKLFFFFRNISNRVPVLLETNYKFHKDKKGA